MFWRNLGIEAHGNAEAAVALQHGRGHGAAERCLNDRGDVAGVQPVAGRLLAIDLDIEVGLADQMEDAEIGDAADVAHHVHHLGRGLLEHVEVRADDLDRIGALHA